MEDQFLQLNESIFGFLRKLSRIETKKAAKLLTLNILDPTVGWSNKV